MSSVKDKIQIGLTSTSCLMGLLALSGGIYGMTSPMAFAGTLGIPVTSATSSALPFVSFTAARNFGGGITLLTLIATAQRRVVGTYLMCGVATAMADAWICTKFGDPEGKAVGHAAMGVISGVLGGGIDIPYDARELAIVYYDADARNATDPDIGGPDMARVLPHALYIKLGLCTCTIPFPSIHGHRFGIVSVYSLLGARSRSCTKGTQREANDVTDAGDAPEQRCLARAPPSGKLFCHNVPGLASLALVAVRSTCAAKSAASSSLPKVDLGYEIHQAIAFNETGQTYNFSNIRYAQPPTGKLRFKAPVAPTGRNTKVQTGAQGRICPNAAPLWGLIGEEFSAWYTAGNYTSFNLTEAEIQLAAYVKNAPPSVPNPQETEDCLFLDIFVPKKVYDNRNRKGKKAAVLLWIHGGGYTEGSKVSSGNPSGLIKASQAGGGDGIVFVQINYRLGALGWLSGPTFEAAGGVSNAGLYDQRLAIEWVAKYAHLFGADGKQITVIGESAGSGSIIHQITTFGGEKGVSFQRAITQSPGWLPLLSPYKQENNTADFLALLNVSTIAEAQKVSSAAVITANNDQILYSTYGSFTFGPAVDGIIVPANPGVLLGAGAFAKDVKIMAGHNTNEGVIFTDPSVRTDAQLEEYLATAYPGMAPAIITYITKTLYPAIYDGSMPYSNGLDRFIFLITESIFTCNTNELARAFGNNTYAYQFEVFPALHAYDVGYTFYNGGPSNVAATPPLIAPLAKVLQGFITNFAMTGNPNGKGLPYFPVYGSDGMEVGLNVSVNSHMKDPTENPRCVFWQKSLFD